MIYEQIRIYLVRNSDRYITPREIKEQLKLEAQTVHKILCVAFQLGWVERKEQQFTSYIQTAYKARRKSSWWGLYHYYNQLQIERGEKGTKNEFPRKLHKN